MSNLLSPAWNLAAAEAAAHICGLGLRDDPHGPQAFPAGVFNDEALPVRDDLAQLALLPDWGIVSVAGDDAISFLHAQTTNDIEHQGVDEARWNAWCTAKGRILAAGLLWHGARGVCFAVSRPLAAPMRKRLSMFVLRARAVLTDESDAFAILGLAGKAAYEVLRSIGVEAPQPMHTAHAQDRANGPLAIGLPEAPGIGPRWWLVLPIADLQAIWDRLSAQAQVRSSDWWRHTDILAGQPQVVAATSELFVPQTLNWEVIGGVSFRKGCYPGQEVVARMHYRGKPKRRCFVGIVDSGSPADTPAPGSDLFVPDSGEPAGVVVCSAPASAGRAVLLYEAPIERVQSGGLRLSDGRSIEPLELPYPLPLEAAGGVTSGSAVTDRR
jgi:tRNA-modifying protein YgfZ